VRINFNKVFSEELKDNPFCVIDVGARGGVKAEWKQLSPHVRVTGFEPDVQECARLMREPRGSDFICHPTALYSSRAEVPFYSTKLGGLSSIREPNREFLERFPNQNIFGYDVENVSKLSVVPLDEVLSEDEASRIDFLKVDVEGCAFEVLSGSQKILDEASILGCRIELEINPKYKDQKLFAEACALLYRHGYELVQIKPCHWKHKTGTQTGGADGTLVHGDFLFLLGFSALLPKLEKMSSGETALKLYKLLIFNCIYGHFDRAFEVAEFAQKKGFWSQNQTEAVRRALAPSHSVWARLPKLEKKGGFYELLYHLFMLFGGCFLKKNSAWKPRIAL